MVHPDSHRVSRVPWYSGTSIESHLIFRLPGYHRLWQLFPEPSTRLVVYNSPIRSWPNLTKSRNPLDATPTSYHTSRVWAHPRSLAATDGIAKLLSLPEGTKMVHFPSLALSNLCVQSESDQVLPGRVAPFGIPRIKACLRLPEDYRSLPRPSSPLCAKASTVHP
jgi:hypothetical protein